MARFFSKRDCPFDLGVLPTELLPRMAAEPIAGVRQPTDAAQSGSDAMLGALPGYRALFDKHLDGVIAPVRAPVPTIWSRALATSRPRPTSWTPRWPASANCSRRTGWSRTIRQTATPSSFW